MAYDPVPADVYCLVAESAPAKLEFGKVTFTEKTSIASIKLNLLIFGPAPGSFRVQVYADAAHTALIGQTGYLQAIDGLTNYWNGDITLDFESPINVSNEAEFGPYYFVTDPIGYTRTGDTIFAALILKGQGSPAVDFNLYGES